MTEVVAVDHDIVFGENTAFVNRVEDAMTTLYTRGLASKGMPELVISLFRQRAKEDEAVDHLKRFLGYCAQNGISYGACGSFASSSLAPHLRGFFFSDSVPLAGGPELPADSLCCVLLYGGELELAEKLSPYRVLSRLGLPGDLPPYFPFAPWINRQRHSVVTPGGAEGRSELLKFPRFALDAAYVVTLGTPNSIAGRVDVRLELPAAVIPKMRSVLAQLPAEDDGFCFLTRPSRAADAWQVWRPGQEGLGVIERQREFRTVTGGFLAPIRVENIPVNRAVPVEDGYFVFLSFDDWKRLCGAIRVGQPLRLPLYEGGSFELAWA